MNTQLLRELCQLHGPSGEEGAVKQYILDYVQKHASDWKSEVKVVMGEDLQDCIMLVFGKPRTAVFAHMDTVGFTVRYQDQLVAIGGPEAETGFRLCGQDALGEISCKMRVGDDGHVFYDFPRAIETGTSLVFEQDWRETSDYVQSCYMDNRLGIYAALQLAESLEDGIIAFSCWEEVGGGSVPYLARKIYEEYGVRQALISDITWATEGVEHGKGVAISLRDRSLPRKAFVDKVVQLAIKSGIDWQKEVEASGGSDGRELQESPYPFDWVFIGAAESNVHSPNELVYKKDIQDMIALYRYLMVHL
ncbi:MAG: M20/M25/M40 family metallo-hydrolase [Cyclobacteriaceae bacterium]|nr:M20/M25/M40 family metallo-hydrolase [Cyclobacteriaceae bacterium]MCH8514754.1 M20/M25/M40 family metallo-hydrolase [Cyclobacteriaceae bacterium]